MEQMEEYVKAQEKSNSPPSTMRVGFKYCAQNDPKDGKRLKSYGPLIKRCPVDQTEQTQEHVSEQKNKEVD
jgi:hypothetical protein